MSDPTEFPPTTPRQGAGSQRIFNVPGVVLGLVAVLGVIHLIVVLLPSAAQWALIQHFGVTPQIYDAVITGRLPLELGTAGALGVPLLTYAFLHGSFTHLAFNAIWMVAIGTPIARRLGALKFLEFFFLSSVLGVVSYIAVKLQSDVPVVGASGGISGLMGGLGRLMFAPRSYDPLRKRIASLTDRRVLTFAIILTLSNAMFAIGDFDFATNGAAVAWQVHVGGFVAGLLIYGFFDDGRPRNWPPLYKVPRRRA